MRALPSATLRDRPQGRRNAIGGEHEESLRVLARLQQAWIGRGNELLAVGCRDRRLATLDGAVEEILAREDVRARLDAAETQRLRAFARDVPNRVEALRTCGVPETLMHGDFHAGNVAIGGGELVIFDWTDGCVSHPFFDLATFLPADPVERAALLQVYLEAWSAALPEADVARAWEIAEPLACLHHAVSYARILDAVAPALRWEFDSDVMFWVRWLREIS
jgi:aminoglycoside phosphotransferase (APT) family kinase protein